MGSKSRLIDDIDELIALPTLAERIDFRVRSGPRKGQPNVKGLLKSIRRINRQWKARGDDPPLPLKPWGDRGLRLRIVDVIAFQKSGFSL